MAQTDAESQGRIEVRAYFTLAPRIGHAGKTDVRADGGRTIAEVARAAGLEPEDVGLTMRNGCWAEMEDVAQAGDRIAFFPDYVPFHKIYGMCVL